MLCFAIYCTLFASVRQMLVSIKLQSACYRHWCRVCHTDRVPSPLSGAYETC